MKTKYEETYMDEVKRKLKKPYKRQKQRITLKTKYPEGYDPDMSQEDRIELLRAKFPPKF